MAQGDSIVGICNAALIELGEDLITSLTDNSKAAILCNLKYDQCRREMLRRYPWTCAKAYTNLAASTTPPPFKWRNAFPQPADYIRLFDVDDGLHDNSPSWEFVGGQIYSDEDAPLPLQYVFDLQDPTRFDAGLARCIALHLAETLCEPLTQSDAKLAGIQKKLAEALPDAQTTDAQSDGPRVLEDDVWLRSRF